MKRLPLWSYWVVTVLVLALALVRSQGWFTTIPEGAVQPGFFETWGIPGLCVLISLAVTLSRKLP